MNNVILKGDRLVPILKPNDVWNLKARLSSKNVIRKWVPNDRLVMAVGPPPTLIGGMLMAAKIPAGIPLTAWIPTLNGPESNSGSFGIGKFRVALWIMSNIPGISILLGSRSIVVFPFLKITFVSLKIIRGIPPTLIFQL